MTEATIDRSVTVVLKEDVTRDQIDDACWVNGWVLSDILPGTDAAPARIVFFTPDRLNLLCHFSDPRMGAQFFVINGADPESVARNIHASLPSYTPEAIQGLLDRTDDSQRYLRGVAYSVLSSETGSPRVPKVLSDAFGHDERIVREEALSIAFWSGDPKAKALVSRVSRRDVDAAVRKRARQLLRKWPAG